MTRINYIPPECLMLQDETLKELQARNEARAKQMIEQMGTKYLCHPANFITKAKFKKVLRKSKKVMKHV